MFYRYAKFADEDVTKAADLGSFTDAGANLPLCRKCHDLGRGRGLIRGMGNNTPAAPGPVHPRSVATVVYRFFHVKSIPMATSDIHGQAYATDYTADYSASGTHYQGLTRVATFVKQQRRAM